MATKYGLRVDIDTTATIGAQTAFELAEEVRTALVRRTGHQATSVDVQNIDFASYSTPEPDNFGEVFGELNDDIAAVELPVVTGGAGSAVVTWTDLENDEVIGYIVELSSDAPAVINSQWVEPGVEEATFPGLAADDYTAIVTAVSGYIGTASDPALEDAVS